MNKDYNHKANPVHIPLSASQNGTWYLGSSTFTLITQLSICTTALHDSKFKIVWELRIVKVPLALKLFYDFSLFFYLRYVPWNKRVFIYFIIIKIWTRAIFSSSYGWTTSESVSRKKKESSSWRSSVSCHLKIISVHKYKQSTSRFSVFLW